MKEEIYEFIKKKVEEVERARVRPKTIYFNEVTSHFGRDAVPLIKELIEEKRVFWGHTINSFWLSTYPKDEILQ